MRLRPTSEQLRFAAMIAVLVASGLAITWLVLPPAPDEASKPRPPPALRVAGALVPATGDRVGSALDLVRRYATGEITIKLPDGSSRKLRRGNLGAEMLGERWKVSCPKGSRHHGHLSSGSGLGAVSGLRL